MKPAAFNIFAGALAILMVAVLVSIAVLIIRWIAWEFGVHLTLTQCLAINVAITILSNVFRGSK